ncbi:hypothetical protein [Novacetimonas pomaceti]|nr:hypothetical protein [Novacetimonas pomaceti]
MGNVLSAGAGNVQILGGGPSRASFHPAASFARVVATRATPDGRWAGMA